jgi:predicted dinucleotide-binding enzyme
VRALQKLLMSLALLFVAMPDGSAAPDEMPKEVVAIIGTGDMGDSLGPRLAALGHSVIYGTREPSSERIRSLLKRTGGRATAATAAEAARAAQIVILAVGWPAMEQAARSLGALDGKIVVDISMPSVQGDDGYYVPLLATSSAEMIQSWNPGARVVKAFATQGSFVIDDPSSIDGAATIPIAADDRAAKETIARMAARMGLDPVDAGPLRMAREIEALQRLYMVPLVQRRAASWEPYFRRSNHWACTLPDDFNKPVADAGNLASIPDAQTKPRPCPSR